MLEFLGLSSAHVDLLNVVTFELSKVPGVIAAVLGGSYARGIARHDSDLDVGLYYSENSPPDIEAIRRCAEKISVPNTRPTVVGYYEWGPWVNGGAWIQTPAGKLDLLYRKIEQVQRVIDESQQGLYQHDYYQQPTFGFVSVIYLAEIKCCLPLSDPQHLIQKLKRSVEIYPAVLRQKMILDCLTIAEFTIFHAHGFADRGCRLYGERPSVLPRDSISQSSVCPSDAPTGKGSDVHCFPSRLKTTCFPQERA